MDEIKEKPAKISGTGKTYMILAIISGLIAMLLGWYIVHRADRRYGSKRTYIAAAAKIEVGEKLTENIIVPKTIPSKLASPNAILYSERGFYINSILNFPAEQGEPILKTMATQPERFRQLSATMDSTRGKRAVTIPVDEFTGVGGFIKEGDRVDIVGTFVKSDGGGKHKFSKVILHNVPILALGYNRARGTQNRMYSSLTLLLSVEEAQLLVFALQEGSLTLLLRPKNDNAILIDLPSVTFNSVLNIEKKITKQRGVIIQ